jgi:hypothetical protein
MILFTWVLVAVAVVEAMAAPAIPMATTLAAAVAVVHPVVRVVAALSFMP